MIGRYRWLRGIGVLEITLGLAVLVGVDGRLAAASAQEELFVTNTSNNSVTVYARTATGNTAPLRTLQGAATGLSGPGAVAVIGTPLRVGSVADARFGTAWTLDGSELANTRAKLLNPANFGVGGTFQRPISITDTAATPGSIDAGLLAAYDVFFIGFLDDGNANAFTAAELTALQTWVTGGGTLIVTCDDPGHDAVCASFGYAVQEPAVNPETPVGAGVGHPIFAGPFGAVPTFDMAGNQGFFTTTAGATVLAQDSTAQPVFLFKAIGAGRVILFADVNIIGGFGGTSDGATITTNNDRVLGNLFAFAGSPTPRLTNLSTRAQAGLGPDQVIAGLTIGGETAKTVLIRALGPTLGLPPFNVPGALTDPFLQVLPQGQIVPIAQSDNWMVLDPLCAPPIQTCAGPAAILATGFAPPLDNEAAVLLTLPPGAYTAILSGSGVPGTGVGLVDVFEVP